MARKFSSTGLADQTNAFHFGMSKCHPHGGPDSHNGGVHKRRYPQIIHFLGFSLVNHPFLGFPIYGNPHMAPWITTEKFPYPQATGPCKVASVLGNVPAFRQLGQAPKSRIHISWLDGSGAFFQFSSCNAWQPQLILTQDHNLNCRVRGGKYK